MDLKFLDKNTFPSIEFSYDLDKTVTVRNDNFENEQNLDILLYNFLKESRDESSNKYSTLYLTDRQKLSDYIEIKSLSSSSVEVFTTWLASDADKLLTTKTDFWVTEDVLGGNTVTVDVVASGTFLEIDNRYFFDIFLLSENLCQIGHTYNNISRFMTINYLNATANTYFCLENGQNPFDPNSTQTFYYLYDRKNDFIVFYKLINDIAYILQTEESTKDLILVPPLTSDDFAFTNDQIFRCRTRNETPNTPSVNSSWVQYVKNYLSNNMVVDDRPAPVDGYSPSFTNIKTNYLANMEYYNLSGSALSASKLPLNILTLKNTSTPESYQSKNNPFHIREDEILMRQYRKIASGTNQIKGNDNISLVYENFTSQKDFIPDQLTYFHAPQDLFPFKQLNIRDTGLIESGAIAGDHPLKSDKLFKKQADYKYQSSFGDTSFEQSGTFLCTWLSGSDTNSRPVWVDRYYFPQKVSYLIALSSPVNPFITYESAEQCLKEKLPILNQVVVDVPSQLCFEPGILYAYHRIGKNTNNQLINSLNSFLFEKNLTYYASTTYDSLCGELIPNESYEYIFNGKQLGSTDRISFPNILSEFTICFYLHADDWKKPFANQLIGNYVNDGFGIFNINYITPFIYFSAPSALHIFNTDFDLIGTKEFNSNIQDIIKFDQLEDYFAILKNGQTVRNNTSDISLNSLTFPGVAQTRALHNINDNLVLVLTGGGMNDFYILNTDTSLLTAASAVPYQKWAVDFTNTGFTNIIQRKNNIFLIQGKSSRLLYDDIWFVGSVAPFTDILYRYNTISRERISAFKFTDLNDMNIDFDDCIWVTHGGDNITKLKSNNEIIFTKTYDLSGYSFERIDLLSYFNDLEYKKEILLISKNNNSFRVDKMDSQGNILNTRILPSYLSASFTDTTGGDFARYYTKKQYPQYNFNTKIKVRNVYDYTDIKHLELKFDLSAFDVGYHHFAVRVDTFKGIYSLFVDGVLAESKFFDQNNYIFNNFLKEPFSVGATPFFNNEYLHTRLKQKSSYIATNCKIKNLYLYNKPLDYHDINLHVKQGEEFYPVRFDIPSGRRSYIDEIEYVFKNKIPGFKSGVFDLVIKNTGIKNTNLQLILEKQIKQTLQNILPIYTKLRNILWKDYNES